LLHVAIENPPEHLFPDFDVVFRSEHGCMQSYAKVIEEKTSSHFAEVELMDLTFRINVERPRVNLTDDNPILDRVFLVFKRCRVPIFKLGLLELFFPAGMRGLIFARTLMKSGQVGADSLHDILVSALLRGHKLAGQLTTHLNLESFSCKNSRSDVGRAGDSTLDQVLQE